jgi:hypothetical protein
MVCSVVNREEIGLAYVRAKGILWYRTSNDTRDIFFTVDFVHIQYLPHYGEILRLQRHKKLRIFSALSYYKSVAGSIHTFEDLLTWRP